MRAYYEQFWQEYPNGIQPQGFQWRCQLLAGQLSPGQVVLDLGCGEGHYLPIIAAAGCKPVALEIAQSALDRLPKQLPDLSVGLIDSEGTFPLDDATVDLVWLSEVVEHVADTARLLSEIRRVLKPGGRLLITTPAHGRLKRVLIAAAGFESHFDPLNQHLRFYSKQSLKELLEQFNFGINRLTAVGGRPLFRSSLTVLATKQRFI